MYRATSDNHLTILGEAIYRHHQQRFGIKRDDRRKPVYILGKTGMGKSTLLANIVISDIHAGEGVAVIDPHGPLVEEILEYIPDYRMKEVIFINATDTARPVPLNPLEDVDPAYHGLVTSGIISIFKKMWADS
jgi:DNA helicase HerA-like ATPase